MRAIKPEIIHVRDMQKQGLHDGSEAELMVAEDMRQLMINRILEMSPKQVLKDAPLYAFDELLVKAGDKRYLNPNRRDK